MKKIIGVGLAFAPFLAFAAVIAPGAGPVNFTGTSGLIGTVIALINTVTPLIIALAVLYTLLGVLQLVMAAGDEEKLKVGKAKVIWGILAIVIMVSIFGIVNFVKNELNLDNANKPVAPQLP